MIRILDIFFTLIGIIFLMPIFFIIILLVKFNSKGPAFYKQTRIGRNGIEFKVLKFRTMHVNADKLGLLTVGGRDPRVTGVGYVLRKYKLDELPQLINVLKGDMSLVGPRPEVKKYTDLYDENQRKVLNVRPGITDWASIKYKDENILLESSEYPEKTYIEVVMPQKLQLNLIYINNYSISEYFKIIFTTLFSILKG